MTIWYLVIIYLGGGAPIAIPQPSQDFCKQNASYVMHMDRINAFCVAGAK
jgi:hypothetical protein